MNRVAHLRWLGLMLNVAFAVYHIVVGIMTHSWWLFTIGVYYVNLSIVRFVVMKTRRSDLFIMRFTGVMLMLLSLSLVGTVILAVVRDRGIVMHEIVMILIAVYAFAKITLAIINLVKAQKSAASTLLALRNISLSTACVSIFALQRSMLVSFGDMPQNEISIFNGAVGAAVCLVVFLLGFSLWRSKKNTRKPTDDPT